MTSKAKTSVDAKDLPEALESSISIPFASARHARIIADTLCVDVANEGGRLSAGIAKTIEHNDNELILRFKTANTKNLRVNINSYLENVLLLIAAIDQFDVVEQPAEAEKGDHQHDDNNANSVDNDGSKSGEDA